jgi:hypothetical protein
MRLLSIFPGIPMAGYGENPYGQPLYRLIFSDSRTDLLGGKWPDGVCEYREVPRYPGIRGQWIMEKWQSAQEYAGTREEYERAQLDADSGLYICGPYPHRGEYTQCHIFIGQPTEIQVGWAVHNNKVSRDLTPGARKQGIMEPLERQQKQQEQRFDDIWDDTMGFRPQADAVVSFGNNWGRQGFKRGGDMPMERFDQAAPLPTADNFFGQIRRQETIGKLTGEQNG